MTTSEVMESPRLWYERGSNLSAFTQLTYYKEGLTRDPAFHPWAECGVGLAHYRLGEHEAAIQHLERAIELAPTLTRAWNNLGLAREALKDWAGAVDAFEGAAQLDPGHPVIIDNLHRARKGLARQQRHEPQHWQSGTLKPLHRRLMVAALAGAVVGVMYNYLLNCLEILGSLYDFVTTYRWFSILLWGGEGACLVAGIVGMWFAKGRRRPWVLAAGVACIFIPYLDILLL